MLLKPFNTVAVVFMLAFAFFIIFFTGFLEFPPASTSIVPPTDDLNLSPPQFASDPFTDLIAAFKKWDSQVGCDRFREKIGGGLSNGSSSVSLQQVGGDSNSECGRLKLNHVAVLVKGWTWIPDNLDNLYSCSCGLSCLWTKSSVLADKPDALLFETSTPPRQLLRNGVFF